MLTPLLQLQSSSEPSPVSLVIQFAIIVLVVVSMWKLFEKAGHPGWAAIIPIYNLYILLKIVNRPGWWLLLFLVPLVNLILHFVVNIEVAKAFGKGTGFGIGLALLAPIFWPMLAFGDATYTPPASSEAAA